MTQSASSKTKHRRAPSFRDVANILEKDACVLCSMLKRFHSACVQEADVNHLRTLCDFHLWAIAGSAGAEAAARILLRLLLLDQQELLPDPDARCSVCERVEKEELRCSDELLLLLRNDPDFQNWIQDHGAVCIPHARRLLNLIPAQDRHVVLTLVGRAAERLKSELRAIADNPRNRRTSIVLSQAAEFLKGRRGLVFKH